MKKVLLISSFFESPYHKNRAPYNEQLFIQLTSFFEIKIIRPIAWTDIARSERKYPKRSYYRSEWNGIPIVYPTYYFVPRLGLPYNGIAYRLSIAKAIHDVHFKPDLYYTTWAYPDAWATMHYARKNNRPFIVRVHGSDINDLAFRPQVRDKVRFVLKQAAAIISPSAALKNKMVELGVPEQKIHVIYSGIDPALFHPLEKEEAARNLGLDPQKKRIVYIGSFKEKKGVLNLVKAVAQMKNNVPFDFEVLLIGWGEDESRMRQLIKEKQLRNIIRVVGPVDHDQLGSWINASDCLTLPSYAEGLPNVVLEALACERKVVATNVGGIPEVIEDAQKYLIEPGNVHQLAQQLISALGDKNYQTLPKVKIKSYRQIAENIAELIHSLA